MSHIMPKAVALALACALTLPLAACGGDKTNQPSPDTTPVAAATPEPTPTPAADPYDAVRTYWSADQLTQAWGPDQAVEHLFFHPVIAYPEYAFSDAVPYDRQVGLDEWMVTADEYKKILQSVYDKGYILVNMGDVWSEVTGEDGVTRMERNTLMLPEGKKPLIISFDDVNYYDYMLAEGFTSKLVLGDDGQIWAQCTDPNTGETFLTQDLDATPILDQFVLEHPDFSLNGAKAIFSLTGYQGILGYRTQNDIDIAADDPAAPPLTPIVRAGDRGRQAGHRAAQGDRLDLRLPHLGPHPPGQPPPGVRAAGHRPLGGGGGLPGGPHQHPVLPPTAAAPTGTTGTPPARCSSISRAKASASSPAWASTPSPTSRRTFPPSSATGSTPTAPPCATARPWSGTASSTTRGRSLISMCAPTWALPGKGTYSSAPVRPMPGGAFFRLDFPRIPW